MTTADFEWLSVRLERALDKIWWVWKSAEAGEDCDAQSFLGDAADACDARSEAILKDAEEDLVRVAEGETFTSEDDEEPTHHLSAHHAVFFICGKLVFARALFGQAGLDLELVPRSNTTQLRTRFLRERVRVLDTLKRGQHPLLAHVRPKPKGRPGKDEKGSDAKVIAALSRWHGYDNGSVTNHEPASNRGLADKCKLSQNALSRFLKKYGGDKRYKVACRNGGIGQLLMLWRGEIPAFHSQSQESD